MPCTDGGPSHQQIQDEINIKAAFCGAMMVLDRMGLVDEIDFAESGITKKWLEAWWDNHKREDKERNERELREKKREQDKKQALSKLSPDELIALGLVR